MTKSKSEDWTIADAKVYAKRLREAGIKARAVRRKNYDSYALVYVDGKEQMRQANQILKDLEDELGCAPIHYIRFF